MRFSMLCLTLSGLLWGTSGLLGSLLDRVGGVSPLTVASARLLIGGALIVVFLFVAGGVTGRVTGSGRTGSGRTGSGRTGSARAGGSAPRGRAAWRRVAANGVLSAVFQGCYFAAISLTSVSLATLITIGAAPVIVAGAERFRGGQPLGRSGVITQGLALAGLALLVGGPVLRGSGGSHAGGAVTLAGCGLALISAAAFAAITVIGTSPVPGLSDLTVNGYGFMLGGLILLPLAAALGTGLSLKAGMSAPALYATAGLLIGLSAGPTAIAYTFYYRGLRGEPASTAALLTLLEPLTAAVLGAVFLGDRLGAAGIAGGLILGAALVRAALGGSRTEGQVDYVREVVACNRLHNSVERP